MNVTLTSLNVDDYWLLVSDADDALCEGGEGVTTTSVNMPYAFHMFCKVVQCAV